MKVFTTINDQTYEIELNHDPQQENHFLATLGGEEVRLELIERKPGSLTLSINNRVGFFEFNEREGRITSVVHKNRDYRAQLKNPQQEQLERLLEEFGVGLSGPTAETAIVAPMPGKILGISVKEGEKVGLGQVVLVLEAMKMENEISSTVEGRIKQIKVKVGDTVATGDVMIETEPHE